MRLIKEKSVIKKISRDEIVVLNVGNHWSTKVSSKFGVYKFLVFSEIQGHNFKPPLPILNYTNRELDTRNS